MTYGTCLRRFAVTALAVVVLLVVAANCITAQDTGTLVNPPPDWFEDADTQGSHYFLHTNVEGTSSYLRPESPDLEKTTIKNRVKVDNSTKVFFPFAREEWSPLEDKYSDYSNFAPKVSIVVNAGSIAGKVLNFELWFDFDGLAKTEADVDAKALFDSKTIMKTNSEVVLTLESREIVGQMKDFSEDSDKGNIKLVVWRSDPQAETLFIYCGAFNSVSWIIVPFSFHRDFVPPNGNGSENGNTLTIVIVLIIIGVGLLFIIGYCMYSKNTKKGVGDEDREHSKGSSKEDHRKRRDRKEQKSKRFYRKNR